MSKQKLKPLKSEYDGTVTIKDLGTTQEYGVRRAIFKCKYCDSNFESRVAPIKNGATISCGCYGRKIRLQKTKKHGDSNKESEHNYIYSRYNNMMSRCYNKANPFYHNYGGKGVTVCDEWKNNYPNYKKWCIENGTTKELHVDKDKICKEQNIYPQIYSPSTCSVLTKSENSQYTTRIKEPTYGYKNVYKDKRKKVKSFWGEVTIDGTKIKTKMFQTAEEASEDLLNERLKRGKLKQ